MRLDKFLCEMNIGSRSEVKILLKKGLVTVNGAVVKSADQKVDPDKDCISYAGKTLNYRKYRYFLLNKPQGVVSATEDNLSKTVLDLLKSEDRVKDLFPVGRLDKDTEGFLMLTNDGELAHKLLSPRNHVSKSYIAGIEHALSPEDVTALEEGVDIGEEKRTLPAKIEVLQDTEIRLTICEGKFHQVKRMLQAVNNHVCTLKRVAFGPLNLDTTLAPGEYREMTESEVESLQNAQNAR